MFRGYCIDLFNWSLSKAVRNSIGFWHIFAMQREKNSSPDIFYCLIKNKAL